jgi:hypothetical protein
VLGGHPRAGANGERLVIAVRHRAAIGADGTMSYANSFEALPADVAFRPERRTPVPRLAGLASARVVAGEAGPAIVAPFDIDGGQHVLPLGGDGDAPPRVGAQVLCGWIDGDPDRPIAVGGSAAVAGAARAAIGHAFGPEAIRPEAIRPEAIGQEAIGQEAIGQQTRVSSATFRGRESAVIERVGAPPPQASPWFATAPGGLLHAERPQSDTPAQFMRFTQPYSGGRTHVRLGGPASAALRSEVTIEQKSVMDEPSQGLISPDIASLYTYTDGPAMTYIGGSTRTMVKGDEEIMVEGDHNDGTWIDQAMRYFPKGVFRTLSGDPGVLAGVGEVGQKYIAKHYSLRRVAQSVRERKFVSGDRNAFFSGGITTTCGTFENNFTAFLRTNLALIGETNITLTPVFGGQSYYSLGKVGTFADSRIYNASDAVWTESQHFQVQGDKIVLKYRPYLPTAVFMRPAKAAAIAAGVAFAADVIDNNLKLYGKQSTGATLTFEVLKSLTTTISAILKIYYLLKTPDFLMPTLVEPYLEIGPTGIKMGVGPNKIEITPLGIKITAPPGIAMSATPLSTVKLGPDKLKVSSSQVQIDAIAKYSLRTLDYKVASGGKCAYSSGSFAINALTNCQIKSVMVKIDGAMAQVM